MIVDGLVFGIPTVALIAATVASELRHPTVAPRAACESCEHAAVALVVTWWDGGKSRVCRRCFAVADMQRVLTVRAVA